MSLAHPHGTRRPAISALHPRPAVRVSGALLATVLLAPALSGCGDDERVAASASASPSASSSPSPSPTPSPTPEPDRDGDGIADSADTYPDDPKNTPQQAPFTLTCYLTDAFNESDAYTITTTGSEGRADFTPIWARKPVSCDTEMAIHPVTKAEKTAFKTSKYDEDDIATLYEMCAGADPDDTYAEAGFAASPTQIPEINAALVLCPKHPQAAKWRQAVKRGQADADLTAQGRLFGEGTFRVGKEIKPGTYVTTDVDGCYWERQNSSGGIIDNYFTNGARRVQVTIRSSDYAFSSKRCGEWRPVR
ncbi:hypothetical protein V6U81_21445 [Micromonospora sp. CPCC 205711]|uniref:hypothetical protein n=1 Tax=Micromonospora sp. CPCC 205547 TaxID=3122400 RepID=UPI002FEFE622